jgi:long-chain acyl-CoA synthetase
MSRVNDQPAVRTPSDVGRSIPQQAAHTVPGLFLASVRRHGPRVAMRHKFLGLWRDISWDQYYERVRQLAMALRALGLQKGDKVAIIGDNCPEWVAIDMGVQCAAGVTVGVYSTNACEQCQYIVSHSEAVFLFVENEEQLDKWLRFRTAVPQLKKVIVWDLEGLRDFQDPMVVTLDEFLDLGCRESEARPAELDAFVAEIDPEDTAMIVYTSGTTGPPKGAMLSHRNLSWIATTFNEIDPVLTARDTDEVVSFLPLCHIFERLFSVLLHAAHGYTVNFVESVDTVTEDLREISPTVGYGVPRMWEKYASSIDIKMDDATWFKRTVFRLALRAGRAHAARSLSGQQIPAMVKIAAFLARFIVFRKLKERLGFERLRVAISGAAPIAPEVLLFFHSIGVNLLEGYGQTESSGVISATRSDRIKLGTVGLALPGLDVKLADDGEILARSPGVFNGYFKDPEATAAALEGGWLHTGDTGEMDDEGFLRIVDRKKDLIITAGGKNIAPQYLENKLKCCTYVNDAVVIGDRRPYLTAVVVLDEDTCVKFAQDNKIQFSTYADLAKAAAINKLIEREIAKVNAQVSRVENIRKFRILPKKLYEEDGEITPTMKVKRTFINSAYKDLIESMYSD